MKLKTILKTLLPAFLIATAPVKADQYQQIDLARNTNNKSSIRLLAGTNELPSSLEAYTLTDINLGKETTHLSETTAIKPLKKGIGPVADILLSSDIDYLSAELVIQEIFY